MFPMWLGFSPRDHEFLAMRRFFGNFLVFSTRHRVDNHPIVLFFNN